MWAQVGPENGKGWFPLHVPVWKQQLSPKSSGTRAPWCPRGVSPQSDQVQRRLWICSSQGGQCCPAIQQAPSAYCSTIRSLHPFICSAHCGVQEHWASVPIGQAPILTLVSWSCSWVPRSWPPPSAHTKVPAIIGCRGRYFPVESWATVCIRSKVEGRPLENQWEIHLGGDIGLGEALFFLSAETKISYRRRSLV